MNSWDMIPTNVIKNKTRSHVKIRQNQSRKGFHTRVEIHTLLLQAESKVFYEKMNVQGFSIYFLTSRTSFSCKSKG